MPDASPPPIGIDMTTPIAGVVVARTYPHRDARGEFGRLFDRDVLATVQGKRSIAQINRSLTHAVGTIRGLHYQHGSVSDAKWVRCLKGRVWDVAVDLRRGSPTFLQYTTCELSADAMNAFFIPEGCAHGFQVIEPDSELLYLHSAPYLPAEENAVRWDDPMIGIDWPLPLGDISDRDRSHPLLTAEFKGLI